MKLDLTKIRTFVSKLKTQVQHLGEKLKKIKKIRLYQLLEVIPPTLLLAGIIFGPFWLQLICYALLGALIGIILCLLLAPLYKEQLKHDPNEDNAVRTLIEVEPGRHSVIMQGGRPRHIIEGGMIGKKSISGDEEVTGDVPEASESWFLSWYWWQWYMYKTTGYHAYFPFFTKPYTYELPRYALQDDAESGERKYVFKRDRSNHVRVETTTWYFEYRGVEVQKVPFTVRGSVQFRIVPGCVKMALFGVDSWNILLDQALNGAIRNFLRGKVTLDDILGVTPAELWAKKETPDIDFNAIAHGIRNQLDAYQIDIKGTDDSTPRNLLQLGINIQRVEIVDFSDELPKEERARFFAAVIGREEGRAIHLRGQGTAKAEAELLAAHKDGGEVSETIIKSRALVDAAKGSDILAALAAGFARKQIGDK